MSRNGAPDKILVAGAAGMVGSAICRALDAAGVGFQPVTRQEADLRQREAVDQLLSGTDCTAMVVAAARVGGIRANDSYPADFLLDNLLIEANLIDGAFRHGIHQLVFLGSSCIYPRLADQPIREDALLTGSLEPTNEAYAIAKIAGIKLCESYNRQHGADYRCLMPTNLYGPGDNFHPDDSHVIPALLRRFHEAKLAGAEQVTVWGSGRPYREFLHVDDLASAVLHTLMLPRDTFWQVADARCSQINVGTGSDLTVRDLAELIRSVVGLEADLVFDPSLPDGTPRKLLDVSRMHALGWRANIDLKEGLEQTYDWFLENAEGYRNR